MWHRLLAILGALALLAATTASAAFAEHTPDQATDPCETRGALFFPDCPETEPTPPGEGMPGPPFGG